jgi:PIN domain nuclease of toxin-antitoxin system
VKYVFDACALISLFGGEEGAQVVGDVLLMPSTIPSIHSVNMIEVFYHFARRSDTVVANRILRDILFGGMDIFDDIDPKIWKEAAHLKTRYRPLSLADAIGVAYTKSIRGTFVTSNHAEFEPPDRDGVCHFFFFR